MVKSVVDELGVNKSGISELSRRNEKTRPTKITQSEGHLTKFPVVNNNFFSFYFRL